MKELAELKGMIDAAKAGQLHARNEFAKRLRTLGFYIDSENIFPHPSYEEGMEVRICMQSCYGYTPNEYYGYFYVETRKRVPHEHDDDCYRCNCEQEWDFVDVRPATSREVIAVLAKVLENRLTENQEEEIRNWELAKGLPTEEDLAKIRRQVEDYLRKNPKEIPAVAKLLKIL
jgi:hypothetical protein